MSKTNLPVLLIDKVILPYNSIQLDFTSEADKTVIDEAELFHHNKVLLVFKRANNQNMVDINNLPNIAVKASIMQDTSLINGGRRLNLKCLSRSLVHEYLYQNGTIESIVSDITEDRVEQEIEDALVRKLKEELKKFLDMSKSNQSLYETIKDIENLNILTDKIAYRLNFENDRLLLYLMCYNSLKRMELVLEDIYKLEQLLQHEKSNSSKAIITRPKREFMLKEKIVVDNKSRFKNKEEIAKNFATSVSKLEIDDATREFILDKINYYKLLPDVSPETFTYYNYISYILSLPWKVQDDKKIVLSDVKKNLDESIYGLSDIKDSLIENLALDIESRKGFSLCLVGKSSLGKSSLMKAFAKFINTEFTEISLDGVNDVSLLTGSLKTLNGGFASMIIDLIRKANTINPVIVINDVDKISNNMVTNALVDIITNNFSDKYLGFKYDLSKVIFILKATDVEKIPDTLKENVEIMNVCDYSLDEKVEITRNYIIPKIALKYDINIAFKDEVIKKIIEDYTKESLNDIKKCINKIFRKAKANIVLNGGKTKIKVDTKDLDKYLSK